MNHHVPFHISSARHLRNTKWTSIPNDGSGRTWDFYWFTVLYLQKSAKNSWNHFLKKVHFLTENVSVVEIALFSNVRALCLGFVIKLQRYTRIEFFLLFFTITNFVDLLLHEHFLCAYLTILFDCILNCNIDKYRVFHQCGS